MTLALLARRSLFYYWRTNLAVIAGVATAVAVLAGALLVGTSVRASLAALVVRRLGATDYMILADHFFRDQLASDVAAHAPGTTMCPVIRLRGIVSQESSGLRANGVDVFGVDDRFWRFHGGGRAGPSNREVLIGEPLARELRASAGDVLLIRLEGQDQVPAESLFGRRENVQTLRVSCSGVLPVNQLGEFTLEPGRQQVFAVFVALETIQRALAQRSLVNTILVSAARTAPGSFDLDAALRSNRDLTDAGIRLRLAPAENAVNVESPAVLLSDALANAALRAAREVHVAASPIYTYLANTMRCGTREIPYCVITAADLGAGALENVRTVSVSGATTVPEQPLWLNEWAREELQPAAGSVIEVSYFIWRDHGELVTESARFQYAGVAAESAQVGPSLAPLFPGITEAASIGAWDPPFPLDMRRIRAEDERYWHLRRTTPKAFVPLERGRQLWGTRFGAVTAVRLVPPAAMTLQAAVPAFEDALVSSLRQEPCGFEIRRVREQAASAAHGSTDFGQYFVYFSFFLIAAALLLAGLFFRLGVEQRAREIGTLLAQGFTGPHVRRVFMLEAAATSACGSLLGLPLAAAYAALLLHGLRSWWFGASGTSELLLHVSWAPLAIGAGGGVLTSFAVTASTLRTLGRGSPRALLSGTIESTGQQRTRTRVQRLVAVGTMILAGAIITAARLRVVSEVAGFFGAGVLLLASALSASSLCFRHMGKRSLVRSGLHGLIGLGVRNASYRPGRTLACVALIGGAIFVIVSLEAFRHDPGLEAPDDRRSGTGGFGLLAESALPIVADLNSTEGLEELGLQDSERRQLAGVRFFPFRLKSGDDASCLNLFAPQEPRILGVPAQLAGSGRFSFKSSLQAGTDPWSLLEKSFEDGAIAAIADANTADFILHKAVGDDVTVSRVDGAPVRLRLVATLRGSVFQRELLIAERNFVRWFPQQQGFRFFMLDASTGQQKQIARILEDRLSDWGLDVRSTAEQLHAFHEVENTYISTFQSLGGLGLILGTAGLAAVLLRNVLERRKELALLQAVGFSRLSLAVIVVAENAAILFFGILCGAACALLAVSPALVARASPLPIARLALLVGTVGVTGLGASLLAVTAALRSPLLPALRSE